jgi:hypothetical protein
MNDSIQLGKGSRRELLDQSKRNRTFWAGWAAVWKIISEMEERKKAEAAAQIDVGAPERPTHLSDVSLHKGAAVEEEDRHSTALLDYCLRQRLALYRDLLPAAETFEILASRRLLFKKSAINQRLPQSLLPCQFRFNDVIKDRRHMFLLA